MSGTILLADDSLTIQKVVELTFADTDHTVVTVSSGDELLEKLPSVKPDIVISDVIMPGTDGYNVCQTIKSDPETLHIPVILLTGTFEPFDRDRALAAGCDEIITKPFEARKLVETVEALLQGTPGAGPAEVPAPAPETYEGAISPPPAPAAAPEEPAAPGDFGTQLAPPPAPGIGETGVPAGEGTAEPTGGEEAEELDFTTTGFDRMRAAGEEEEAPSEPPAEGLDFDLEPVEPAEAFGEATAAEEFTTGTEAAASPFGMPSEPAAPVEETPSAAAVVPEETTGGETTAPVVDQPTEEEISGAETGPIEEPAPLPEVPEEPVTPPEEISSAPLETVPETTPPSMDEVPTVVTAPTAGTAGTLSDEDIDRIARRVLELASERLERIAWEVIPDMAEIVVRERIRELEAEAEGDTVQ